MKHSKTKTSFYRRLYIAYLIDRGINTVPAITAATGMPRRTAQDTLSALHELGIECEFVGANKDGHYRIRQWGPINQQWLIDNLRLIQHTLEYPAL
ncbi:winged helix-turn-helix domain-containing protein [Simiduia curdlanivorans]|uniref:Winged helix-turn-helix domain-containing protein n=1 Tax=Simiduia curdlanivorans TaxID=1492769 RepID=A0ABV8V1Y9_9GAMM